MLHPPRILNLLCAHRHQTPSLATTKVMRTNLPFVPLALQSLRTPLHSARLSLITFPSTRPITSTTTNKPPDSMNPQDTQPAQSQTQDETAAPGLPEPESSGPTHQLDMSSGQDTASLEHLGPLVVNVDGTLSRISNWAEMGEGERRNTLRVLGRRNKARLEALKGKAEL